MKEIKETFNFYDPTYLKSYNLDQAIKYQLNLLDSLDVFTRKHSFALICTILEKCLYLLKSFKNLLN